MQSGEIKFGCHFFGHYRVVRTFSKENLTQHPKDRPKKELANEFQFGSFVHEFAATCPGNNTFPEPIEKHNQQGLLKAKANATMWLGRESMDDWPGQQPSDTRLMRMAQ